jgi:alkylated DNA nucleotide flippase Atl1
VGDWTKVEAAVDLLEIGEWTTYADLAEIANLTGQQVQDRLYDTPLPKSHRVFLSRGAIDARAPWARDNIDAYTADLVAEGILEAQKDTTGRPEARLGASVLAQRIGED